MSIRSNRSIGMAGATALWVACLWSGVASAQASEAACCLRGTTPAYSQVHSNMLEPDEKFFLVKGGPPNLMFILDSSGSMMDLPVLPEAAAPREWDGRRWSRRNARCANPAYDAIIAAGGFTMSGDYPPPDLGVAPDEWIGDSGFPNLFRQDRYYRYREWSESDATHRTLDNACQGASSASECRTCVSTKGYWLDPDDPDRDVFAGKFLNYYSPKYVTARTVIKQVIWNTKEVRMGLAIFDGNSGAKLISKPNPPCDKALNPDDSAWVNNRKNLINTINNTSTVTFRSNTPLAESLFHVGQMFMSDDAHIDQAFGSPEWRKSEFGGNNIGSEDRVVCWGCQTSTVVLITDGEPTMDNCVPQCIKNQGATCNGCNTGSSSCGENAGRSCPSRCGSGSNCKSAGTGGCCSTGGQQYLDDVAKYFWENDLQIRTPTNGKWSPDGVQRLATYTVGFAIDHPLLANTAAVGGGTYYTANDRRSLEDALRSIVDDVNRRSTAFGSSAVSTLQTGTNLTSYIPRFVPGRKGETWNGYLFNFRLVNERTNGCRVANPPDPNDRNQDGDCDDLYYVDADDSVVEEDPFTGAFVKRGTTTPAKPVWEAGAALKAMGPDARKIWTVVDSADPSNQLDASDKMIEFVAGNAQALMPYMGISPDISLDLQCRNLLAPWGYDPATNPPPPAGFSSWGHKCAQVIIDYFRGKRANDPDPARRNQTRDWLLGDIFHSSPVLVEPPVQPQACVFYPHQCLSSVFTYKGQQDETARQAWMKYITEPSGACGATACERRKRFVLVGSNSGFIHAFDAGDPKTPESRQSLTGRLEYTDGTGRELWAFIPPDLLGKLKYHVNDHGYFVDGTAMVRDVWVDGKELNQGNGVKEAGEFRTIAVIGERSGGQHYFALDVTADMGAPNARPQFLWMWPQPCDEAVRDVGESWSNFYPKPPPIVPVLLDAESTGYGGGFEYRFRRFDPGTSKWNEQTAKVQERWVVALNGGYDKLMNRGRGFALVDVWTGQTLWSEFFRQDGTDMQRRLEYPIAAGIALLDIGAGEMGNRQFFDGYFDTFTVGDMGGNFWVGRLYEPGRVSAGRVTNWTFARAFETEKASGSMTDRRPISFISSNALQQEVGYLRSFFGTGDRAAMLETGGGACSLDNVPACISMGCRVEARYVTKNAPSGETQTAFVWSGGKLVSKQSEPVGCVDSACYENWRDVCAENCTATACSGSVSAHAGRSACDAAGRSTCAASCSATNACTDSRLELHLQISACPGSASTLAREVRATCTQAGAAAPLECRTRSLANTTEVIAYATMPSTRHRFFGIHAFGGGSPPKLFSDEKGAEAFDEARLTETDLVSLGSLSNPSTQRGSPLGPGWYIDYDDVDERTASPAGITTASNLESGCVLWNSLQPSTSGAVCGGAGEQVARLIQADYITGAADCAAAFDSSQGGAQDGFGGKPPAGSTEGWRFRERRVITPPPEPAAVVMAGGGGTSGASACTAAGAIQYGVVSSEPGRNPEATVTATQTDIVQSVYQLELNPAEHMCRHRGGACTP